MIIIAVDDERLALESLLSAIREALPEETPSAFRRASHALEYAAENGCDVAFLDIRIRGTSGLALAEKLKAINPNINIIFVTGYSEYALEAIQLYASDYLLKPVDACQIRRAMEHLRCPIPHRTEKKIRLQCFGYFEVYADGVPLHFKRTKSKEILAYLTDRMGASCTMGQLMTILWEDGLDTASRRSNLRNSISDLRQTLAEVGAENIISKNHNSICLNCSAVECDYYDYLQHKEDAVNQYHGEYMLQYTWAEITTGSLLSIENTNEKI